MIILIYLIIAFTLGFYIGIKFILFSIEKKEKKEKSKIEDLFLKILENKAKLKFGQRVHTYVQIKIENYLLVYMMDKQELTLFKGEDYIANSTQINPDISEKIIDFIKNKFDKEINDDVVEVGGYLVSQSYIDEVNSQYETTNEYDISDEEIEDEYEEYLNLDDILDKINSSGINSLTNEEREFLNNYGK